MSSTKQQLPALERAGLTARQRYSRFFLLLLAAGAIYPLIYLRQNFETSILAGFGITADQLGGLYSRLGVIYALSYVPSGWLADRFSPRRLIAFSLAAVGVLGLWFSRFPGLDSLQWIFMGWGLAAGLTFWASLIKGVKSAAGPQQQGRFFGLLDGGRGLVEAVLATLALVLFAKLNTSGGSAQASLVPVIYLYSGTCLVIALMVLLMLDDEEPGTAEAEERAPKLALWPALRLLMGNLVLWLLAIIIFCGYQLFWATYSFSAYLQDAYGMSAVGAGVLTVAKLWMRPIGGIGGGFLGDRFGNAVTLAWSMLLASISLILLVVLPRSAAVPLLLSLVLLIGVLTYAVRGIYWSILEDCQVPASATGLAIGLISMIGYLPDIFLPMISGAISLRVPGVAGTQLYLLYIALCGLLGSWVAFYFKQATKSQKGTR